MSIDNLERHRSELSQIENDLSLAVQALPQLRKAFADLDSNFGDLIGGISLMQTLQQKDTVLLVGLRNVLNSFWQVEQTLRQAYFERLNHCTHDYKAIDDLRAFSPAGEGS